MNDWKVTDEAEKELKGYYVKVHSIMGETCVPATPILIIKGTIARDGLGGALLFVVSGNVEKEGIFALKSAGHTKYDYIKDASGRDIPRALWWKNKLMAYRRISKSLPNKMESGAKESIDMMMRG